MDDITRQALRSWEWRPDVIAPLLLFLALFSLGWWRLRRLAREPGRSRPQLAAGWRLVVYWLGVSSVALALVSPLDVLAGQLFFMHMIQHMFLIMLAPPLIWLTNPMPVLVWGLPMTWRRAIGRFLFQQNAPGRATLYRLTGPATSWFLFFMVLWGWHSPDAYDLTLRNPIAHNVEHLTFFAASMLTWWHITGAGPRWHKRFGYLGRAIFALSFVPVNMILGVSIALAPAPIYAYYTTVPRLWGLSALTDQQISGVIMWIPGSEMHIYAVIILVARWLRAQERDVAARPATDAPKPADDRTLTGDALNKVT